LFASSDQAGRKRRTDLQDVFGNLFRDPSETMGAEVLALSAEANDSEVDHLIKQMLAVAGSSGSRRK
jgi:hypothetical protein